MSFWTSERFKKDAWHHISPFDPTRVKECAYDLSLGAEAFVTGQSEKKMLLQPGEQLLIPPGQFALLLTEERVSVPTDAIGFISVKSKFKLHGLVNVSGFHVDPGFRGKLIFSVYNAGGNDFRVSRGDPLFLLWLAELDDETKTGAFEGPRQHQSSIPDSDIMALGRPQFSPSSMNDRLSQVEANLRTMSTILIGLFVAIVTATVLFLLR